MATRIDVDGTETEVQPRGRVFTLAELYALVACETVEMYRLADGRLMWMDEDGKRRRLPANDRATRLAYAAGLPMDDYIVGPVLLTTLAEVEGNVEGEPA